MKIVDQTHTPPTCTTTLAAIPLGQVFRGTILGDGIKPERTGTFLKCCDSWVSTRDNRAYDVLVISFDRTHHDGAKVFWITHRQVVNYEPLDATLTLSKGQ